MKKIYMVYNSNGGRMPAKIHHDIVDAKIEATRLAEKHKGDTFHILQTTQQVHIDPPKPQIKEGDLVLRTDGCCKTIERECGVRFATQNSIVIVGSYCFCIAPPVHVKLVRPAPKSLVLEGVQVSYVVDGFVIYLPPLEHDALSIFKRYKMTLTEEDEKCK